MGDADRKRVFRLFAMGMTPEQVVETLQSSPPASGEVRISKAEELLQTYLALPIGEKLQLTLLPEWVSNRTHRLIDDIADLKRVDALLATTDDKKLVSLLDIKRRIKERMAKECSTGDGSEPHITDSDIENEINRIHEKVCGTPPPQE
ncbi:MAG: hypothetical protein C4532_19455 [Candidatus Abyssobacteria bacterium SURF_17]|uniref:Uncharacterized protein n=1 Tax=Candidatus Abyssobacteria bacterium SURF_17 TaxID=2093361 RepID=A0A419ENI4_9BACT|nr:MAG: hypothetical protein C4532_19455 [Candidatus Abyssubacteria bacterium SURF_17]